ncbi:unnamed protein product [Bursaphelenchus xylophilus]|nr:unnamed protein product [Bursaphelenchus xylophilus]CAG9125708.1 unnamed protein product [Bursaphelenchus xylophilus]
MLAIMEFEKERQNCTDFAALEGNADPECPCYNCRIAMVYLAFFVSVLIFAFFSYFCVFCSCTNRTAKYKRRPRLIFRDGEPIILIEKVLRTRTRRRSRWLRRVCKIKRNLMERLKSVVRAERRIVDREPGFLKF